MWTTDRRQLGGDPYRLLDQSGHELRPRIARLLPVDGAGRSRAGDGLPCQGYERWSSVAAAPAALGIRDGAVVRLDDRHQAPGGLQTGRTMEVHAGMRLHRQRAAAQALPPLRSGETLTEPAEQRPGSRGP